MYDIKHQFDLQIFDSFMWNIFKDVTVIILNNQPLHQNSVVWVHT